jgi:hypothetical protein
LKELRARARADGVDADELEDAADMDDPKAAVIDLLLERRASRAPPADADEAALREELLGLKFKELRHRAKQRGIDEEALEDAADHDEPRQAVIELLVGAASS